MKNYEFKQSVLAKSEDNDCVVRTIGVAFGWEYQKAHLFCKNYLGRQPFQGVTQVPEKLSDLEETLEEKFGIRIQQVQTSYFCPKKGDYKPTWVRKFIQEHSHGIYIILGKGHAWVIKDGEIKDWSQLKNKIYREIYYAYQVTQQGQLELF